MFRAGKPSLATDENNPISPGLLEADRREPQRENNGELRVPSLPPNEAAKNGSVKLIRGNQFENGSFIGYQQGMRYFIA